MFVFYILIEAVYLKYLGWQNLCLCKINEFGNSTYVKYELLYIITNNNFNNHGEIQIYKKKKHELTQSKINDLCTHSRI